MAPSTWLRTVSTGSWYSPRHAPVRSEEEGWMLTCPRGIAMRKLSLFVLLFLCGVARLQAATFDVHRTSDDLTLFLDRG
jgi:hypothetical protein